MCGRSGVRQLHVGECWCMAVVVQGGCIVGVLRFERVKVVTKPLFIAFLAFFTIFCVFSETLIFSKTAIEPFASAQFAMTQCKDTFLDISFLSKSRPTS